MSLGRHTLKSPGTLQIVMRVASLLVLLLLPRLATAQATGSLSGTVKDGQGLVLPGVTVELTSETKGTKVSAATTDANGDFTFVNLAPDTYLLQAGLPGFKTFERRGLRVSPTDLVALGALTLEVGTQTETVTVTAEAPLVRTESGDRTFTATTEQVQELPFASHSFTAAAQLAPGTFNPPNSAGTTNDYLIARVGAGRGDNVVMMDGASMMDTGSNRASVQVSSEAVAQVTVLTTGFQAEYGRAQGLIISAVSKTGTNKFRGSAFTYRRNSAWNSNSQTNILNGDPKPVDKRLDYGYSIGGPVGKPGGANKLFFFIAEEISPRTQGSRVNRFRVPTALERAGDFSQTRDNLGNLYPYIKDPSKSGPCNASSQVACFADNGVVGRIPQSALYGPGLAILNWYPQPSIATVPAGQGYNLEVTQATQSLTSYQPNIRLDYQPSTKLRLGGRVSWFTQAQNFVTLGTVPGFNDSVQPYPHTHSMSVTANYSATNTLFLEATVGHSRDSTIASCPLNSGIQTGDQGAEFCQNGILVNSSASREAGGFGALPQINPDANVIDSRYFVYQRLDALGASGFDPASGRYSLPPSFSWGSRVSPAPPLVNYNGFGDNPTLDISVSATKIVSKHTMKVGFLRSRAYKTASAGAFGTINFQQDTVGSNPFDTSFGFANAAIGSFSSFAQPSRFNESQTLWVNLEGYVQDNWKATSRLTLGYGVRFSHMSPVRDVLGQQSTFSLADWQSANSASTIYQPGCASGNYPCSGTTDRQAFNPLTNRFMGPNSAILIGTIVPDSGNLGAGVTPVPGDRAPYTHASLVAAPRFGAAYDLTGSQRSILRGSVGLFYPRPGGGSSGSGNPGLNPTTTLRFSQFQSMGSSGLAPVSVPSLSGNVARLPLGASAQWNLEIQQVLPFDIVADVAYVGVHGYNEPQTWNLNGIDLGSAYLSKNQDPTLSSTIPGGNALPNDLMRFYRGIGAVNIAGTSTGSSQSHSLQLSIQKRLRNGLSFGFNDTFDLVETSTIAPRLEHRADGTVGLRSDQAEAQALLGSSIPARQILKGNVIWQLPRSGATTGAARVLALIVNDWQASAVWTADTGRAYNPTFSYASGGGAINLTGSPDYAARVRIVGDPGSGCSGDRHRQFNTAAFQGPTYNSTGLESGTDILRTCFREQFDLSLQRRIRLGGERALSLRADVFNLFNEAAITGVFSQMQLSTPNDPTTIQNLAYDDSGNLIPSRALPKTAGFGVANAYQAPRSVQLQVRFSF